ncbi:MAG: type II toxin-antitoxin system ParD family antitoxin [Dehalococcoidia bacterium]
MDVTFPAELEQFIDLCVAEGFYVDRGEVVRDAVRRLLEEMSSDEYEAPTSHLVASSEGEDDGGFASLSAAVEGLGGDDVVVPETGDELIDLLVSTRERLLALLELVELDILHNTASGSAAGALDVSTGVGSTEAYVTIRLPRSESPGTWRTQALAAPRGPLVLADLGFARSDVLLAIAEVNEAQAQRIEQVLDAQAGTTRLLSDLLRQISDSNAEVARKLR